MITLESGLLFEDSKEMLSWGITRDKAWRVSKPSPYNLPEDKTRIKWEATILGGLDCGILAYLPNEDSLDHLTIWIRERKGYRGSDALYHYLKFFDHLASQMGSPIATPSKGNLYGPILTWEYDSCSLQLYAGERHGDFCTLEINHGRKPRFNVEQDAAMKNQRKSE